MEFATKKDIRKQILRARAGLKDLDDLSDDLARSITYQIQELLENYKKQNINISNVVLYESYNSEPPTYDAVSMLNNVGYNVFIPNSKKVTAIGFVSIDTSDVFLLPNLQAGSIASDTLFIVPALAVDGSGTRLGRGGGWYDKHLIGYADQCDIYALVYDNEVFEECKLPNETYDIKVNGYITPSGYVTL